ncbi:Crp/Fnr family transcriptional regulator [Muricauda sp. 334s03]|uniref:Crp/Fnr family transcriptional regulator n=2 Tax=Flagellimonas TaxID=444459 RepID=A0ABT5XNE6_9FLAO|nr:MULTISPECIES: Crp/Fnr family transcriptional regulator [Allomuricauda]MDF0707409.1 Crp/Fnr family transcriptional regulator [[Muricauda] okinawensis]MDF0715310.1 Crp/Fnr family transcriptional regulator [[Muricauda] yonaguniensis]
MTSFIKKFNELKPVPLEIEREISSKIRVLHKRKGDFLYRENQFPDSVYLITKGCLRTFYHKNGKEKNTSIILENIIFGSTASVFFNQPAIDNAQFLEHSTIELIPNKDLTVLYEKYPEMETYRRKVAEEYCIFLEEKIRIMENTASNKYKILVERYPEILQRVSLQHIANLLNITQETLSRIRVNTFF